MTPTSAIDDKVSGVYFTVKTAEELLELGHKSLEGLVALFLELQNEFILARQKLAINSNNSSKPPSQDGYNKPKPKSLRLKTGKKSGGQPGHLGTTLKPVEKPDIIKVHQLSTCPCGCGSDLSKQPVLEYQSRQVFELPPQKLVVTQHDVEVKRCPISGELVHSIWPEGVTAPVQYGTDFLAWLVYLNTQQFIPLARISQMSFDLFGHHVSEDTILSATKAISQELVPFSDAVKEQIQDSSVVNADESGLRVKGKINWLHVLSTNNLTWYGVHVKRGEEAIKDFCILPKFTNTLIHDCWKPYLKLGCKHGLCVAHIIRELTFIHEECKQAWAKKLIDFLLEKNQKRDEQKLIASSFSVEKLEEWQRQYQEIILDGRVANPPLLPLPDAPKKRGRKKQTKAQNLLDRLEKYEDHVLAFLHDFEVPFTNNLAEQDVRMIKVKQKVSGTFRTSEGAERFVTIRSYISTLRKQGLSILQHLKAAIVGNPFIPEIIQSG